MKRRASEEGHMVAKIFRSRATARAAVIVLTLGVFALAALAVFSTSTNARTTGHVRAVTRITDQWGLLDLHVSIEYEALSDYLRAGSAVGRQPLVSAIGSADVNLAWLSEHGEAQDVENATDFRDSYAAYTETLRELVAAGNAGDQENVKLLADQASLGASTLRKSAVSNVARKRLEMDLYLTTADQENRQMRLAATVIFVVDLLLLALCALILLTHQRRVERQAVESRYQALHDGLTGLANRVMLADRIEQCLRTTGGREDRVAGLLLLDLNKFKDVNDTLGHQAGDLLLQEVASRLSGAVRDSDTVARLGGDEFAVLLPRVSSAEHCMEIAGRLLEALQGPADLNGVLVDISGSIGAALYPDQSANAAELLQHADIAMYAAKRNRAGTSLYDPESSKISSDQLGLTAELHRAVEGGQLILHYQPKVATTNGQVVGVEALVRWQHPTRGLLAPSEFIAQAEESGVIVPLTDAVLDMALAQHRQWRHDGTVLPVAVNIATACLHDVAFPDRVAAVLATHGVPAGMLTLEITETSIITDPARAASILVGLRALGVRISVDDFGTGYSSMAYLQSMPLDELKIDRSFVKAVHESASDEAIVRAILELSRALELDVVAEGVENEAALAVLATMGCAFAQGYHMSRPLPAADLIAWVSRQLAVTTA
jgi:diguanylate cyclase (GGDEF)-like protein